MYTRLDHFQEDLFAIFDRARKSSKLDSRTFRDSITLQTEYMRIRSVVRAGFNHCYDDFSTNK